MKEIPIDQSSILAPFFEDTYDSCAEAFLQGVMGRGFTDSMEQPTYGVILMGDFCFLGGNGDGPLKKNVVNILKSLRNQSNMICVPLSVSWNNTLAENKDFERVIRYAMNKPDVQDFNREQLTSYIKTTAFDPVYVSDNPSRKYVIKPVDTFTFMNLPKEEWAHDLFENYHTYVEYVEHGLGYLILEGATGIVASSATTFCSSNDSLEIQITTNPAFEGKGFATALAARFILESIKLGKRPSWDAANLASVHIAEKLGYHIEEEYVSYQKK